MISVYFYHRVSCYQGGLVSGPSVRGRAKVPCWGFSPMDEPLVDSGVLVPLHNVAENEKVSSLRDLCDQAGDTGLVVVLQVYRESGHIGVITTDFPDGMDV